jgi:mono/diheme cytochrome c family protein
MKPDRPLLFPLGAVAALLVLLAVGRAAPSGPASADAAAQVARGEYLVKRVGLCADCHAPRRADGSFDPDLWLRGAALPFRPTVEMPWAAAAPPIAGLPTMAPEDAVRFLRHGTRPDGTRARPPMPAFELDEADARAVVAYLRSLAP